MSESQKRRHARHLASIRAALREADLAGLGPGFPDDEYDGLALQVYALWTRGLSPECIVEEIRSTVRTQWGTELSSAKADVLREIVARTSSNGI